MIAPIIATVALAASVAAAPSELAKRASLPSTLGAAAKTKGAYFGTCLTTTYLNINANYTNLAKQQFTIFTPENEMKWEIVEPGYKQYNFQPADTITDFAFSHGLQMRGHTFVWANQLPAYVNSSVPATTLDMYLKEHIDGVMSHYKGQIYGYDVVNEHIEEDGTIKKTIWSNAFGIDLFSKGLRYARAADPKPTLYINDYNTEALGPKSDGLYSVAKYLLKNGSPLGGIGFQSHFILGEVPTTLAANFKRFADLGLDIAITELDIRMPQPPTAADYNQQGLDFASVVNACLSVGPRCVSITTWGFTDFSSWIPGVFTGFGTALQYDYALNRKDAWYSLRNTLAA